MRFGVITSATCTKLAKTGSHGLRVGAVCLAVVAHDRVHHRQSVGVGGEEPQTMIDLLLRAQKAAVNALKFQTEALIMLQTRDDKIGEIPELHLAQTAGVSGEDSRWNRADLNAHGGQRRQDHRQGTAAEAGKVVDSGHTGRTVIHKIPHLQYRK